MPTMVPDRGENPKRKLNFYDMDTKASHTADVNNGLQLTHDFTKTGSRIVKDNTTGKHKIVDEGKHLWVLSRPEKFGADEYLSRMETNHEGVIRRIETEKEHQRQGHATTLFKAAQEHASKIGVAIPQHSGIRTKEGNAWTKSLGEKGAHKVVSSQQFWNGWG